MALLWVNARRYEDDDQDWSTTNETHDDHPLNPAFKAAGIKEAPCAFSLCDDHDADHSNAFDRAETKAFHTIDSGRHIPTERVDLSKPVYGFEPHADMHAIRRYTKHPESRPGGHPTWFRHEGKHYIFNGHHGTAGALRRGDTHLTVHMIDLDKDD